MLSFAASRAQRLLLAIPPEQAHAMAVRSLELGLHPRASARDDAVLAVRCAGLEMPNPLAVAAGFDKDARVPHALIAMGLGYAEVGTVTPKPQSGNPRPRVFRIPAARAIINRLGFNNGGHAAALERLRRIALKGVVGVNIGANKETADRVGDYVLGLNAFYDVASYFTVNISSPNTPGLRDLQAPEQLDALLSRLMDARAALISAGRPRRPIVVKIAPDIAEEDVAPIAARLIAHGVDAIAVSNTTLSRTGVSGANAKESGGLSGRPLFHRSTVMLARMYQATAGKVPLIGIGGIDSGETALAKIEAGATLLQLYTGLIYEGPELVTRIKAHLASAVRSAGVRSIQDLTGRTAAQWAAKSLA